MRTNLGGDIDAAVLAPANQFDRAPGAHVREVHVPACQTREKNVANHHYFLGLGGNSFESELGADDSLVHRSIG